MMQKLSGEQKLAPCDDKADAPEGKGVQDSKGGTLLQEVSGK